MFIIAGRPAAGNRGKLKIYNSRTLCGIFTLRAVISDLRPLWRYIARRARGRRDFFENYTKLSRPITGAAPAPGPTRVGCPESSSLGVAQCERSISVPRGRFCHASGPCHRERKPIGWGACGINKGVHESWSSARHNFYEKRACATTPTTNNIVGNFWCSTFKCLSRGHYDRIRRYLDNGNTTQWIIDRRTMGSYYTTNLIGITTNGKITVQF